VQTIAQYYIQEGKEIGEKQGEERGVTQARREDILRIMQLRFQSIPPTIERKIRRIRRPDRLNALLEKAVVATDISEIETELQS
jgi:hypothetical protein